MVIEVGEAGDLSGAFPAQFHNRAKPKANLPVDIDRGPFDTMLRPGHGDALDIFGSV
jgi:hypothetical protein